MAWIESHQEIGQHPKTKRLARMLGESVPAAIGHLHLLWHWALDFAQDGDLTKFDPEDIADAAMWDGDAETFVDSLVDCGPGDSWGFAERDESGLRLHDWDKYAGRLIDQRAANAKRARKSRETKSNRARIVRAPNEQRTDDERAACGATVPDLTVPNQKTGGSAPARESDDATDDFATVYRACETSFGFAPSADAIDAYMSDGFEPDMLVALIEWAGDRKRRGMVIGDPWRYAAGTLDKCRAAKLFSLAQWESEQAARLRAPEGLSGARASPNGRVPVDPAKVLEAFDLGGGRRDAR